MTTATNLVKRVNGSPLAPPEAVIDDKKWTEGDFEIITSDNVRFRVPSYHLFSNR